MEFYIYNDCRYDFLFTFRENVPPEKVFAPFLSSFFSLILHEIITQIITLDKNILSKLKKWFDLLSEKSEPTHVKN